MIWSRLAKSGFPVGWIDCSSLCFDDDLKVVGCWDGYIVFKRDGEVWVDRC